MSAEAGTSLILRLDTTFDLPFAAAGTLDASFDGDGKAVVNAPPGTLGDEFKTVIQADGKVVAAGYVGGDVAVVRFNPDGSLDTTFDFDGIAVTDFGGSNDKAHDVTVQSDGKIVVAGGGGGDLIVGRYNVNGTLDATFDGDGKVKRDFGAGDQALAVEVDAAGKVVLAGGTNDAPPLGDLLVVRLNANGSLDTTFDADGSRVIDLGDKTLGLGLALDRTGRVVVGGVSSIGTDVRALLIRLTSGGAYDTSFSTDGIVREDFGGSDEFNHLAVDDRGRVVAAGNGGTNGAGASSGRDAIAARYTEAGALDTSFGSGGKRYVHLGGSSDNARDMALDPFGRAVLVGDDGGVDFAVARLTVDGALDTTFDGDGLAKVNFVTGNTESGQAIAIQTDGRIVVVGRSGNDFAVARLSGGGTRNYAVQDANFNTTALTDATGKVLERYQYDPYGAVKVLNADFTPDPDNTQDVNQPYLWQGGALVTATGTYHFRRRDYSPSLGRWVQQDPIGYRNGLNLFEYVGSSPPTRRDPTGLDFTNSGDDPVWVWSTDGGWESVPPGDTLQGDYDFVWVPEDPTGDLGHNRAYKWIDCFDYTWTGSMPVMSNFNYFGGKGLGRLIAATPLTAGITQVILGGASDPRDHGIGAPPGWTRSPNGYTPPAAVPPMAPAPPPAPAAPPTTAPAPPPPDPWWLNIEWSVWQW